jgi:alpha-tubulin suppressor-like RCC1 family protein
MKRTPLTTSWFVIAAAATLTTACEKLRSPLEVDSGLAPSTLPSASIASSALTVEFLPPLGANTSAGGVFVGSLAPEVIIYLGAAEPCADGVTGTGCPSVVAHFTTGGKGNEAVRVNDAAQHYFVNWQVGGRPNPAAVYRIVVRVAGTSLGSALLTDARGSVAIRFRIMTTPPPFALIATGEGHACGIDTEGAAWCWGANNAGQLGATTAESCTGDTGHSGACSTVPVRVSGGLTFSHISAGTSHTCAVAQGGALYCWGANARGELGNGTTSSSLAPVPVAGGHSFTAVDAQWQYTCALTTAGDVFCWGWNGQGQLGSTLSTTCPGLPAAPCSTTPVLVPLERAATQISSGLIHACARTSNGATYCWGSNAFGQMGIGTTSGVNHPPTLVEGGGWMYVTAGAMHSCTLTQASSALGKAFCSGASNTSGALGRTWTDPAYYPAAVDGDYLWQDISASDGNYQYAHTCAVTTAGEAYCWGSNDGGQLGSNAAPDTCTTGSKTYDCAKIPQPVPGGLAFTQIHAARAFTCGLTTAGRAYCWGFNHWGQLGDGTTISRSEPAAVLRAW